MAIAIDADDFAFFEAKFGVQILDTISELGKIFTAACLRKIVMASVNDS